MYYITRFKIMKNLKINKKKNLVVVEVVIADA